MFWGRVRGRVEVFGVELGFRTYVLRLKVYK